MSTECSRSVWNMRLQIQLSFGGDLQTPCVFVAFIIQSPSAEMSSAATVHNMAKNPEIWWLSQEGSQLGILSYMNRMLLPEPYRELVCCARLYVRGGVWGETSYRCVPKWALQVAVTSRAILMT